MSRLPETAQYLYPDSYAQVARGFTGQESNTPKSNGRFRRMAGIFALALATAVPAGIIVDAPLAGASKCHVIDTDPERMMVRNGHMIPCEGVGDYSNKPIPGRPQPPVTVYQAPPMTEPTPDTSTTTTEYVRRDYSAPPFPVAPTQTVPVNHSAAYLAADDAEAAGCTGIMPTEGPYIDRDCAQKLARIVDKLGNGGFYGEMLENAQVNNYPSRLIHNKGNARCPGSDVSKGLERLTLGFVAQTTNADELIKCGHSKG